MHSALLLFYRCQMVHGMAASQLMVIQLMLVYDAVDLGGRALRFIARCSLGPADYPRGIRFHIATAVGQEPGMISRQDSALRSLWVHMVSEWTMSYGPVR